MTQDSAIGKCVKLENLTITTFTYFIQISNMGLLIICYFYFTIKDGFLLINNDPRLLSLFNSLLSTHSHRQLILYEHQHQGFLSLTFLKMLNPHLLINPLINNLNPLI